MKKLFITISMSLLLLLGACTETTENSVDTKPKTEVKKEKVMSDKEYADEVQEIASYLSTNFDSITTLANIGSADPSMVHNKQYVDKVIEITEAINSNADQARELKPSKTFKKFHKVYMKGIKKYDKSATLFRDGIKENDMKKVGEAAELMDEGTVYTKEANDILAEILASGEADL